MAAGVKGAEIPLQWIPAGTFRMGDPKWGPVNLVHITRGFWIGRYLVTQAQWSSIMGTNPSAFQFVGPKAPIDNVSWNDAVEFCRRLTALATAGRTLPDGYEIRLPTEAEWEYACRAGTTGDFGGDGVLADMGWTSGWTGGWFGGTSDLHTHPVGLKLPNAWGLYDMHGNVWEWCFDHYGHYSGGEMTDPAGPISGPDRVHRGGSWEAMPDNCTSAFRSMIEPGTRLFDIGFRVALAPRIP